MKNRTFLAPRATAGCSRMAVNSAEFRPDGFVDVWFLEIRSNSVVGARDTFNASAITAYPARIPDRALGDLHPFSMHKALIRRDDVNIDVKRDHVPSDSGCAYKTSRGCHVGGRPFRNRRRGLSLSAGESDVWVFFPK